MSDRISADEARRLREAATPGPWWVTVYPKHYIVQQHPLKGGPPGAPQTNENDAALIAAAPDLAATAERLEADNQRLRRNQLAEAFIRGFEAGAERPEDAGDGDAMYQAFRSWSGRSAALSDEGDTNG